MRDTRGPLVDRLLALLMIVQDGQPLPAMPLLAERFGVCRRTILRDVQALRRAGLDVQTAARWEWA